MALCFFFSSRRRHTRFDCDWSSDVCSSDLCSAGTKSVANLLNSGTFVKRNGKWQVVNWQSTRMPQTEAESRRSEERRVGKECRSRGSRGPQQKNPGSDSCDGRLATLSVSGR